jgi:CRISPR-associated protein Csm5
MEALSETTLKIKNLTTTFIGSGNKISQWEVFPSGKTVKIIKFDRLVNQLKNRAKVSPQKIRNLFLRISRIIYQSAVHPVNAREYIQIIQDSGLRIEELWADYSIPIDDRATFFKEIEEFIKTQEKVYIPGSEIKGAIRTAIFYYLLTTNPKIWSAFIEEFKKYENLLRNESFLKKFALHWENKIFAGEKSSFNPQKTSPKGKEDLLKFLVVRDSQLRKPEEVLILRQIYLKNSKRKLNVWIESLREKASFNLTIIWRDKELKKFLEKELSSIDPSLKQFWTNLNIEKILEILDRYTRDLLAFEEEKRGLKKEPIQKTTSKEEILKAFLEKLKQEKENSGIFQELKKEKGYLIRLGKFTGRYSHSVLLAIWKKDYKYFQKIGRKFPSKTYWEDSKGNPLGFLKMEISN